jgi:hypothetical protein
MFDKLNLLNFLPAFVLVTPDDEVKESFDEMFRNVIARAVLGTILKTKTNKNKLIERQEGNI